MIDLRSADELCRILNVGGPTPADDPGIFTDGKRIFQREPAPIHGSVTKFGIAVAGTNVQMN